MCFACTKLLVQIQFFPVFNKKMLIQLIKNKYAKSFSGKKATHTQQNKKKKNNNYSTLCLIANQAGIITDFQFNAIKKEFKRKAKKKAQIFINLTN